MDERPTRVPVSLEFLINFVINNKGSHLYLMIAEVKVSQEVVLGIIDHFKRNNVQKLSHTNVVSGAIQGRVLPSSIQFEKVFEVPFRHNSFEVDEDFLNTKLELEKMVNPELELVGFYITSSV